MRIKRDNLYDQRIFSPRSQATFSFSIILLHRSQYRFQFQHSVEAALVFDCCGVGTLWGPVIGTVLLSDFGLAPNGSGQFVRVECSLTVYSLILMAVLIYGGPFTRMADRGVRAHCSRRSDGQTRKAASMGDALVVRSLSKRFGGTARMCETSVSRQGNETVALIGPNGAGKTTSFTLSPAFHRPDCGFRVSALARRSWFAAIRICAHGLAGRHQVAKPFWRVMTVLATVMTGASCANKNPSDIARARASEG